jgi:hypothetical protein
MISLFLHTFFVSFIAFVLLSIIHAHERDGRNKRLLQFLVVAAGTAAIAHRLLLMYGVDF